MSTSRGLRRIRCVDAFPSRPAPRPGRPASRCPQHPRGARSRDSRVDVRHRPVRSPEHDRREDRGSAPRRRPDRGCSRGRGARPPGRDVRRGDTDGMARFSRWYVGTQSETSRRSRSDENSTAAAAPRLTTTPRRRPHSDSWLTSSQLAASSRPRRIGWEPMKQALIAPTEPPTRRSGVTPAAHRPEHPHLAGRHGNHRRRGRRCCVRLAWRNTLPPAPVPESPRSQI
jgi:hypothetical protein